MTGRRVDVAAREKTGEFLIATARDRDEQGRRPTRGPRVHGEVVEGGEAGLDGFSQIGLVVVDRFDRSDESFAAGSFVARDRGDEIDRGGARLHSRQNCADSDTLTS